MAKKTQQDLVSKLRANGIKKRSAKLIARSTDGRRKPAKQALQLMDNLGKLLGEAEDRVTGGPAKRSAAARKAVRTRKRNAAKRSEAAKKGARTRAKSKA